MCRVTHPNLFVSAYAAENQNLFRNDKSFLDTAEIGCTLISIRLDCKFCFCFIVFYLARWLKHFPAPFDYSCSSANIFHIPTYRDFSCSSCAALGTDCPTGYSSCHDPENGVCSTSIDECSAALAGGAASLQDCIWG